MSRIISLTAILFVIGLMGSCLSFKIQPPPEPENQVDSIVLSKRIEQREGLLFPGESLTEFKAGEGAIHCFVRLENVNRTIRLKWKWYTSEGRLFRETKDVTVNRDPVYLETVTAYDHIAIEPDTHAEGRWTVVVMLNGQLIGRRTFLLIDGGSPGYAHSVF
jgi:hypothetical protein